jgi:hypothetical protein
MQKLLLKLIGSKKAPHVDNPWQSTITHNRSEHVYLFCCVFEDRSEGRLFWDAQTASIEKLK